MKDGLEWLIVFDDNPDPESITLVKEDSDAASEEADVKSTELERTLKGGVTYADVETTSLESKDEADEVGNMVTVMTVTWPLDNVSVIREW